MLYDSESGQAIPAGPQLTLLEAPAANALAVAATAPLADLDLLELLLQTKASAETRRGYAGNLRRFFYFLRHGHSPHAGAAVPEPDRAEVWAFIGLPRQKIAIHLTLWKAEMRVSGLSEASINRALAAVKSLLKLANRLDYCVTDGRGLVDGEKVITYRDTHGPPPEIVAKLLEQPYLVHGPTLRGHRDTAMLGLLYKNGLRRAEVCKLTVGDFSLSNRRIAILGKGRGTQKEFVTITPALANTIAAYLLASGHQGDKAPLFQNLHHDPTVPNDLEPNGLYKIVRAYGQRIGIRLSPHMLRHSAITTISKATNGNRDKTKEFSRHAKDETVAKYIKQSKDTQGEMTAILEGLVEGRGAASRRRKL